MPISTPYITPRELRNAPTGNAWLETFGITGNSQPSQDYNLMNLCQLASDLADNICNKLVFNPTQKDYMLRASLDTETANTRDRDRALVDEYGNLVFSCTFRPIISVTSMTYIPVPGNGQLGGTPTVIDPRNIFYDGRDVNAVGFYMGGIAPAWGSWGYGIWGGFSQVPLRVSVEYVNGFANTLTTADVAATDTTLTVTDPTGITPGQELTIYDLPLEHVLVDFSYDGTSSTIPLINPLQYDHTSGVRVSAMGSDLQQACVYLCMDIVQSRAQQGITAARQLPGMSGAGRAIPPGMTDFYYKAEMLLDRYILTP